jgi:hypothetical protein
MLALFKASESQRADQASSLPAERVAQMTRKQPSRWEVDSDAEDE